MEVRGYLSLLLALAVSTSTTYAQVLVSCDFETNFCPSLMVDPTTPGFTRNAGGTPSEETGPDGGAQGSAYYIFFETSGLQPNTPARVMTYSLNMTGTVCVSFDYHMYGKDINALNLKLKITGGAYTSDLWSERGNKGNMWYSYQNEYRINSFSERLVFESLSGSSYQGDIALDNIRVWRGTCDGTGAGTTSRTTSRTTGAPAGATTKRPTTDIIQGCNVVWQCNFRTDFNAECRITESSSDNADWTRITGDTTSAETGPTNGYQGAGDYYYYFEATGQNLDDSAVFYSPNIEFIRPPTCVRVEFQYHMWGNAMGKLEVSYLRGSTRTTFFVAAGDQGNLWQKADVQLNPVPSGPFSIEFKAIRGNGYRSDIAVDEILVCDCSQGAATTARPTERPTGAPLTTTYLPPGSEDVDLQPSHVWVGHTSPGAAKCTVRNTDNLPYTWSGIRWYTPNGLPAENVPGIIIDTSYTSSGQGYWSSVLNVDPRDYQLSGRYTCEVNYNNRLTTRDTNIAVQGCPRGEFTCADMSGCIPCHYVCDNFNDCGDYSDEFRCGTDGSPLTQDRNCN